MAYEDLESTLSKFLGMTGEAISLVSSFMGSMTTYYGFQQIEAPNVNAVLNDPTYRPIESLNYPSFDSSSSVPLPNIYKIADGEAFDKVLAKPPVFQGEEKLKWAEAEATWLKDSTRDAIRKLFNETGFEIIEIEMSDKGKEKRLQLLRDSQDSILVTHASKGFTMPNDRMNRDMEREDAKYDEESLTLNDSITFGQLDLAQKNAQFGINAGLDGEAIFISYFSRMTERALKAAMATIGLDFEIFNTKSAGYNALIKARRAKMQGAVEIETSLISNYNAELDAKQTEIEAKAENLSSIISSYKSLLSTYKSEISSDRAQALTTISWRNAKFREQAATLRATFETDITKMHAALAEIANKIEIKTASANYYVNYLAAALGALQVQIQDETILKNLENA